MSDVMNAIVLLGLVGLCLAAVRNGLGRRARPVVIEARRRPGAPDVWEA